MLTVPRRTRVLILLLVGIVAIGWRYLSLKHGWCLTHPYLDDQVGIMDRSEVCRIDRFLAAFKNEMAADIRVLVVPNTGGVAIEKFSLDHARAIGLGQDTDRHGLLLVYDVEGRRMRIEVGSKLEGVFTDGFVGFLIREHLRSFATTDRMAIGLRATLVMTFNRIRQSVLGEEYDPRAVEFIEDRRRLVVGGGTTAEAISADTAGAFHNREASIAERDYFTPQPTVEEAYSRFLDWLAVGATPSNAPLFTGASQEWLRDLPITNAYGEFMILLVHGKSHQVAQSGNLAMLYYTTTPFVPPLYFRKGPQGWQMDVIGQVLNSVQLVGYPYTWSTQYSRDDYSEQFGTMWESIGGGVGRVSGGDNRALPIHTLPLPEKILSIVKGNRWKNLPQRQPPPIDTMTSVEVGAELAALHGRPVLAVFYYTSTEFEQGYFRELVQLAAEMPEVQVVSYSLDAAKDAHWIPWLFERHQTDLAAKWVHPSTDEELTRLWHSLGQDEVDAARCACARAMAFDANGKLLRVDEPLITTAGARAVLKAD